MCCCVASTSEDSSPAKRSSPSSSPCPVHSLRRGPSPFVLGRQSSLLVDAEGDAAHEFWEEERRPASGRMRRVTAGLTPLGWVQYAIPRLRADLPFIMYDTTTPAANLTSLLR